MINPAIPANEMQRLAALKKLRVLDTPLEERFDRITRMVCTVLGVPMAAFSLIDEKRQWQKSNVGLPGYMIPREQSFCSHVVLEDKIMNVPDTSKDIRFSDHPAVTGGLKVGFYAGAQVRSPDGYNVGTLCAIDTQPRELTSEQLQVLRDLADMVETELRANLLQQTNTKLEADLQASRHEALLDPLTHLWNRSGAMQALKQEWINARKLGAPIVVAMLDLDHFKKINDTYGHPGGDLVLQSVARRMTSVLRTNDVAGRIGGEEFLVVLPNCGGNEMPQVLERIRQLVSAVPVMTDKGEVSFTLSCGAVLAQPTQGMTIEEAIRLSDSALYKAKENGRNRIEIATAE